MTYCNKRTSECPICGVAITVEDTRNPGGGVGDSFVITKGCEHLAVSGGAQSELPMHDGRHQPLPRGWFRK